MRLHQSSAVWLAGLVLAAMPLAAGEPQSGGDRQDLASLDLEKLLNVKVTTASKFAESLRDASGVVSVITQDEIRRFGAITLQEVLERVPGLTGASAYFSDRLLVAARGDQTQTNGGHILILINGRPTREILEGGIVSDLLESFPVGILERIEVIRGPGSVLYGSDAFSAVINLITQKADKNGFVASGLPGTSGARAASGQATLKLGDVGIVAAAQFHESPAWTVPFGYVDPQSGAVSIQNASIRDRGPGGYLGVNYKGLSFTSAATAWDTTSYVWGVVGQPRMRRGFADLGYRFTARPKWEMTFNATYTRTTFKRAEAPSHIDRNSYELVGEWTNFIKPSDRDQLTIGTLYNYERGEETYTASTPNVDISDGARPAGALYAQWDHRLLDRLKLLGGFQANKISNIALDVVPRAGVVWDATREFTIKALYGEAFRAPSLNETYLNHPGLAGNRNLQPEKVQTVDLAVAYQGRHFQAGVDYFHSLQTNSIVLEPSVPRMKFVNLGSARFQGVETEAKYYPRKSLLLSGSVLRQMNSDGNGTQNVTPMPNLQLKGGISYEREHGVTAGVFDSYQGALDRRYNGLVNPNPEPYHLLSCQFRIDLSRRLGLNDRKGVALFVHGENLANYQVWLPGWGDNGRDTMPVYRGRTIHFGVEVWFRQE